MITDIGLAEGVLRDVAGYAGVLARDGRRLPLIAPALKRARFGFSSRHVPKTAACLRLAGDLSRVGTADSCSPHGCHRRSASWRLRECSCQSDLPPARHAACDARRPTGRLSCARLTSNADYFRTDSESSDARQTACVATSRCFAWCWAGAAKMCAKRLLVPHQVRFRRSLLLAVGPFDVPLRSGPSGVLRNALGLVIKQSPSTVDPFNGDEGGVAALLGSHCRPHGESQCIQAALELGAIIVACIHGPYTWVYRRVGETEHDHGKRMPHGLPGMILSLYP